MELEDSGVRLAELCTEQFGQSTKIFHVDSST